VGLRTKDVGLRTKDVGHRMNDVGCVLFQANFPWVQCHRLTKVFRIRMDVGRRFYTFSSKGTADMSPAEPRDERDTALRDNTHWDILLIWGTS
jgi:hypothetical protein